MNNRLHLDFQIESIDDRNKFLEEYLQREEFIKKPLTEEELETCANYILWGKDKDGKNVVQRKEIQIKTKNGTWDKREDDSLDALLETPSFNEATIIGPNSVRTKIPREVFSRTKALKDAPDALKPIFKDLFYQIDKLDLTLNYYDLAHGKRKNPPREELLQQFTPEEQLQLEEDSKHLNQFKYLKMRHLLVELRRQQFTLKDSYSSIIQRHTVPSVEYMPNSISFETEISVLPLGTKNKNKIASLIFRDEYIPSEYTEEELQSISNFLWEKKKESNDITIDFRELEHVYNLFTLFFDLEDEALKKEIESETGSLLQTLKFYTDMADLSEAQREILNLKVRKYKNQDIANIINQKYNKSYTANYISTIFRQKIIRQINEAAQFHEEIIGNLFFPENFKRCTCCNKMMLRAPENFVRKTRAKDGFSNRCKRCDKADRLRKKESK